MQLGLRILFFGLAAAVALAVADRAGVAGWLPPRGESVDPCRSPLAWHLRAVDPRFGLAPDEIRGAVREAAHVWEAAAGRRLFREDTAAGMAIDLVYDERQQLAEQRRASRAQLDRLATRADELEARLQHLEPRLRRAREALDDAPSRARSDAYRDLLRQYNAAVDRYNAVAEEHNRAAERLRVELGGDLRAGDLRASSRTLNGTVLSVERVLTVALVGSRDELVVVLSHELGHALGLDHVPTPGALMAESYRQHEIALPVRLEPADLAALRRRCGPATGRAD